MEDPGTVRDLPDAGGAEYTRLANRLIPTRHGDPAALNDGAALVDRSHRTVLRLAGGKAVEMLNAVLTNDAPKGGNLGVYALLLNPKGRIQTDLRVLKRRGEVFIDVAPAGTAAAKELLGRYAPFYRVEVEDLSETNTPWGVLGLYGPQAKGLLDTLDLAEHETAEVRLGGADLLAAGVAVPVPGYDLLGPAEALDAAVGHLAGRGAVPVDFRAYETARIKAGIPRFGSDITPENFPAEAGLLERAVSFEKGCYPGQETVARMHYRGHPNKRLHRLLVEGTPPAPGTEIFQGEKKVGYLTSLAPLPVNGERFALGYLSRNADTQDALRAGDAAVRSLA
jgi:tRNA-modifying protein YgfZ